MGGNAPFLIFESSNISKAVHAVMASKFRCSGQASPIFELIFKMAARFKMYLSFELIKREEG